MFSLLKAGVDRLSYLVTEILPFQTLRSAHKLELNIIIFSATGIPVPSTIQLLLGKLCD